jgi:hypothetical protein
LANIGAAGNDKQQVDIQGPECLLLPADTCAARIYGFLLIRVHGTDLDLGGCAPAGKELVRWIPCFVSSEE